MTFPARLLIATDFSEAADLAERTALAWAERLGARVDWAHVPVLGQPNLPPRAEPLLTSHALRLRHEATDRLSERTAAAGARDVEVGTAHVLEPPATEAIVALAKELGSDCIVVGHHGQSALTELWAGSVATSLARSAPCSVLAVRPGPHPGEAPRAIVTGEDFSEGAALAADAGRGLADELGASLHLVHALDLGPAFIEGVPEAARTQAMEALRERFAARAKELGATPHEIVSGSASHALCDAAGELGADLVVVGTHGRTGWRRALLGSVAERVLHRAPCSVLLARGEAEAD